MNAARRLTTSARRLWLLVRLAWAERQSRHQHREEDRELARQAVRSLFSDARGVTMKVGQMLTAFAPATTADRAVIHARARPLAELRLLVEATLGAPIEEVFAQLDESAAAASLGQVHRGVLLDGRVVAVKLRYPDIADAVSAELSLAGLIPGLGPVKSFGFDLDGYRRWLAADLSRELDYRGEAARQQHFKAGVAVEGLVVPEVLPELSGETLLVQSWEQGAPLAAILDWPRRDRLRIARTLTETLLRSLFVHGEIHADPNPGNLLFRRRADGAPEVVLLDYGCTLPVAEERRLALLQLIQGCRTAAPADALGCFAALGFDAVKLATIAPKLPALAQILFEPFLLDRAFDSRAWRLGERVDALLGELRWWFRSAGPPDMLLMLRAFQGLVAQLDALGTPLPFWPLTTHTCGPRLLEQARQFVPPATDQALAAAAKLSSLARWLKVRISEGDHELLALTLPAAEVAHLEQHIPQPIRLKIAAHGIELRPLVADILASGIGPREVFTLADEQRQYRVWLE